MNPDLFDGWRDNATTNQREYYQDGKLMRYGSRTGISPDSRYPEFREEWGYQPNSAGQKRVAVLDRLECRVRRHTTGRLKMLEWLKWRLARAEMEEVARWRSSWMEHRRWFAEFDAAATVLDHMHCEVRGVRIPERPMCSIMHERDELRKRTAPNDQVQP